MLSRRLQIVNPTLLVCGQTTHPQDPAHRRGHAPDDVLAESRREQCIVAMGTDRK